MVIGAFAKSAQNGTGLVGGVHIGVGVQVNASELLKPVDVIAVKVMVCGLKS